MASSFVSTVLNYACPSAGVVLATLTFSAPIESVRHAAAKGSLGVLNSTPFVFMTGNTLGWLAYSYVTKDLFVFFANAPGLLISLWLNMTAIEVLSRDNGKDNALMEEFLPVEQEDQDEETNVNTSSKLQTDSVHTVPPAGASRQKRSFLAIVCLWLAMSSVVALVSDTRMSHEYKKDLVGVVANINLGFFYAAPLSTISLVLRTRDSSTIHRKTLVLNTVNASFWSLYGLTISDPFILLPNLTGIVLGFAQVVCCLLFPRGSVQRP